MCMSMLKGVAALFALVLCASFGIAFLPNIANLTADARTDPAVDSGLACTADVSGNCNITLTTPHMYADTSGMKVEVATASAAPVPGTDITDDTTVGVNRAILTLKDLTAAATYTFDVDFMKVDAQAANATGLTDFLNLTPLIFILMLLVVGMIVGGASISRIFR